jgi:hypothetical protein
LCGLAFGLRLLDVSGSVRRARRKAEQGDKGEFVVEHAR